MTSINSQSNRLAGTVQGISCEETTYLIKVEMQSTILIFAALLVCVYAQVSIPPGYAERYPDYYKYSKISRHPRDLNWERGVGGGRVFGTLGSTDDSVFGRGGYKQDIFNDHRGRLEGLGYGSRVLGATGDSTRLGGQLNWSNDNARLGADVHRDIGGRSGATVTGEGVWKLDHKTRLVVGGHADKTFGHERPDIGIHGKIETDF